MTILVSDDAISIIYSFHGCNLSVVLSIIELKKARESISGLAFFAGSNGLEISY